VLSNSGMVLIGVGVLLLVLLLFIYLIRKRKKYSLEKNETIRKKPKIKGYIEINVPTYLKGNVTLYNAIKEYPFLLSFFEKKGLSVLNNPVALNAFGKRTTLNDVSKKLGVNKQKFISEVNEYIHNKLSEIEPEEHKNVKQ